MKANFAGIEDDYAQFDNAKIVLQSVPYDGTSTWGKGADVGFDRFLEAAENMELYDIETDSEVYKKGIVIPPPLCSFPSPEAMFLCTYDRAKQLLASNKFLTFFGGEHSISIGVIKAFYEEFRDLSVLQIDAHADLRPNYQGTQYNHACAVYDASRHCNLVQVGIRSMDKSEKQYIDTDKVFFAQDIVGGGEWVDQVVDKLTEPVYITLDLDAFDPSIMPATGTPEPGGLFWYDVLGLLRRVFENRRVVGFDIVELAPIPGLHAPQFLAAKLYYKMLSYQFFANGKG